MNRPAAGALLVLVLLLAACGEGDERGPETAAAPSSADCAARAEDEARSCYRDAFTARVVAEGGGLAAVEEITAESRAEGGFLLSNCHGIMHAVGRAYAENRDVSLASLMEHLPASNDPGCPAGFAHGVVTAVAPELDLSDPAGSASVCGEAASRYQRYSCVHGFGHAFMRAHRDDLEPALALCRGLGPDAPDCAQGAFHDYWFAVAGLDDAERPPDAETDPRILCADQPDEFVRPCWYRAFVDRRPEGVTVEHPRDIDGLCVGLAGLQREACVTAAAVIGPPDPRVQLPLCLGLEGRDQIACVHGAKAQNLLGQPPEVLLETIERCELFAVPAVRRECFRWLGTTLSVVTDGAFADAGCPQLRAAAARRACRAGAAAMEEPLVTFS